jgi:hypothetical protein
VSSRRGLVWVAAVALNVLLSQSAVTNLTPLRRNLRCRQQRDERDAAGRVANRVKTFVFSCRELPDAGRCL